ncbi:RecX family transcriptional regulator [Rhizobium sp. MHM7A]|uniref:RecX family transcriptional regulator n=1 Tax=Rhizobium sp. MHM7A TaxID=2583233 RepID=UPI001107218C|nr:RecX family transcriptional regulator [Rhizobium sp. MHM7A]TLX16246.1 RecX family transcriptional regulator [Rhizobium sp. MHM7A]
MRSALQILQITVKFLENLSLLDQPFLITRWEIFTFMTAKQITREQFFAWIDTTHGGRQAFDAILPVSMFLDTSTLCAGEGQIEFLAELLEYPGDHNWKRSNSPDPLTEKSEAEQQAQDLAMIVRKLLKHVPDDVPFKAKATDYLVRKGLTGSILRASENEDSQS